MPALYYWLTHPLYDESLTHANSKNHQPYSLLTRNLSHNFLMELCLELDFVFIALSRTLCFSREACYFFDCVRKKKFSTYFLIAIEVVVSLNHFLFFLPSCVLLMQFATSSPSKVPFVCVKSKNCVNFTFWGENYVGGVISFFWECKKFSNSLPKFEPCFFARTVVHVAFLFAKSIDPFLKQQYSRSITSYARWIRSYLHEYT